MLLPVESELGFNSFPPLGPVKVQVEVRRVINPRNGPRLVVAGVVGSPAHFQVEICQLSKDATGCWVVGQLIDRLKLPGERFGWRFVGMVMIDGLPAHRPVQVPHRSLMAA